MKVMPELMNRFEDMILDSGGSVERRSRSGSEKNLKVLHRFGLYYHIKNTRGTIRVYSIEQPEGKVLLLIIADER